MESALYQVIPSKSENGRTITLRVTIDKGKMEYIVAHPDEFELGNRIIHGVKLDKVGLLSLVKDYLDRANGQGACTMRYYQRNGFGRHWTAATLGMQKMNRKIRHTLCQVKMYDIDKKNAHPTLLLSFCHKKIECRGWTTISTIGKNTWQIS